MINLARLWSRKKIVVFTDDASKHTLSIGKIKHAVGAFLCTHLTTGTRFTLTSLYIDSAPYLREYIGPHKFSDVLPADIHPAVKQVIDLAIAKQLHYGIVRKCDNNTTAYIVNPIIRDSTGTASDWS